jgi:hypothetical protein
MAVVTATREKMRGAIYCNMYCRVHLASFGEERVGEGDVTRVEGVRRVRRVEGAATPGDHKEMSSIFAGH